MTYRRRLLCVLLLALAGAAVSGVLLLKHHGEPIGTGVVSTLCGEGAGSGCDRVNASGYASIAGIPLAALGLFFYASLALLAALASFAEDASARAAAALALLALGLALVVDLALLGVQAFAIHAFCTLCLLTYAINAAALALLWPARRDVGALRGRAGQPADRVVLAAWVLGSLFAGGAAAAADAALASREGLRARTMLGGPPAAAGALTPPPPGSDPVAHYRDEARRLQGTLDDPDKLQAYLQAKANRDFEGYYDSAPALSVNVTVAPMKGTPGAPIQVVEYADFLCPACRSLAAGLAEFLPRSAGRIALHFKHYPLDSACNAPAALHPGACILARGGICAQQQGKFWPYHDRVFGSSELKNPGRDDVLRLAGEAGLDRTAFAACLDSPQALERLRADIQEAKTIEVSVTPTLVVNGKKLKQLHDFMFAIEKESRRRGLGPLLDAGGQGR